MAGVGVTILYIFKPICEYVCVSIGFLLFHWSSCHVNGQILLEENWRSASGINHDMHFIAC